MSSSDVSCMLLCIVSVSHCAEAVLHCACWLHVGSKALICVEPFDWPLLGVNFRAPPLYL